LQLHNVPRIGQPGISALPRIEYPVHCLPQVQGNALAAYAPMQGHCTWNVVLDGTDTLGGYLWLCCQNFKRCLF
jgi:hypothetical protein